jgi:membrane protein
MKTLLTLIRGFIKALERNSVRAYSAAAAFFALISLSPFAIIIAKLQETPVALLSAAGISALWAASHCMFTVIRGLEKINGAQKKRNWFKLRLLSVIYTLFLQLMLTISLSLLGVGILFAMFLFLYRVLPALKTPLKNCVPGALTAAISWSGFSYGYALYVENFANFDEVYGSFAAAVATMLWLYFCMYILFAGAQINEHFAHLPRNSRPNLRFSARLTPPRC